MLPKNLYTVIVKQPKQIIPAEYLELILSKKPNVFGYAVQDGEGLSVGREEGTPLMVDLETMNTETSDLRSMLCFGWLEQGFNVEDIQPFTINDGDDKPFVAIGLDGDFPKYDTNNGRTQEYNLVSEIIGPSLADICELTDGEIAKLMAALGKPMFNNNFLAAVGHRGVLDILPFEGDDAHFGKDTLGGDPFTWGRTSNLHTWGEEKQEPVKQEEPKKRFSFGKKEAPKTSVPEVKAEVKPVADAGTKLKGAPIKPPEWLHSNEDKKAWYTMVSGGLPKEWKRRIPIIPIEGITPPAKIEDLNAWRAMKAKARITSETVAKPTETSAGAPKSTTEVEAIRAEENLPIIPAKDMEKVLDFVTKHLDGQSVEIVNPKAIQNIEKKLVALSTALGTTPQEMLNWPVSGLFGLAKTDPRAIVLMALEFRNLWRDTLKVEDLVGTSKTTTTTTKVGDTGTKVESVSNEALPKKKLFSFGKKAA